MAIKRVGENALAYVLQKVKSALAGKVDKVDGKGLSSNDYTTPEKEKLSKIADGANKTVVTDNLTSTSSTEALSANQGRALNERIDTITGNMENLGGGDMMKANYDTDGDGVVDNAAKLGGQAPSYYAKATDIPTVPAISTNINTDASSDTKTVSPKAVKSYVDSKTSAVYKPQGSVAFASLPTLSANIEGNVYNVTDAFTTTASFVEGAGVSHTAGTNVVCISDGSGYKWDVLAGTVDLSAYTPTSEHVELSNTEIDSVWNTVFGG